MKRKITNAVGILSAVIFMLNLMQSVSLNCIYEAQAVNPAVPNGIYWIINAHSGKALTRYNSGTTEGTNIVQSENVDGANQRWQVTTAYNSTYENDQCTMIFGVGTYGCCIGTPTTTLSNGTNVYLAGSGNSTNAHWDIEKLGTNGNYKIVSKSGPSYALIVEHSSSSNVYVKSYTSSDLCNDEWIFVPVSNYSLRSVTVKVQLDSSVRLHYTDHSEF